MPSALRACLATALLCLCVAAAASPAEARQHHRRHAASSHHHHARFAHHRRRYRVASHRHHGQRHARVRPAVAPVSIASVTSFGSSIIAEARRHLGANAFQLGLHRTTLWCATFMNYVMARTGHRGTGSDLAASFAAAGPRLAGPQPGAIAVMHRRGGGHVGVVSGVTAHGDPIIISGNSRGSRVTETVYPRGRIYAYVVPR